MFLVIDGCRAYETLIAALANIMGTKENPITVQKFKFLRSKMTPLNQQSGDCGIYTLKCIECAALGLPFNGLEDKNVNFLRMKLAVDVMTELPHGYRRPSSQPNPRFGVDKEKLNTASQGLRMAW